MEQKELKMLNLGCGNRFHEKWVNVDVNPMNALVMKHDLKTPLPFDDSVFDVVYHSHVLEHFEKKQGLFFLNECFRVLKSNGIIRVVVPDLEQIVNSYLDNLIKAKSGDSSACERYEWTVIELIDQLQRNFSGGEMAKYWQQSLMPAKEFVIDRVGSELREYLDTVISPPVEEKKKFHIFRKLYYKIQSIFFYSQSKEIKVGRFRLSGEPHLWMYDSYSLQTILKRVGFVSIAQCKFNESLILNFNQYLLDIEVNGFVRKPDSLFMEALKI